MNSQEINKIQVAVYQKEKGNNIYCGDSYFYTETEDFFICAIADGLGSGQFAQESSMVVINTIKENIHLSNDMLIKICRKRLLGHRGVVLGILKIDFKKQEYTYLSIGNIGLMTLKADQEKRRYIPSTGYLPHFKRSYKEFKDELQRSMTFFMFSDGMGDDELSSNIFMISNVDQIIKTFEKYHQEPRDDDTTLIAIRYEGY